VDGNDLLGGEDDPFTVASLPGTLLTEARGIDPERTREAVASRALAFGTAESGTRIAGPIALAAESATGAEDGPDGVRSAIVDALAGVLGRSTKRSSGARTRCSPGGGPSTRSGRASAAFPRGRRSDGSPTGTQSRSTAGRSTRERCIPSESAVSPSEERRTDSHRTSFASSPSVARSLRVGAHDGASERIGQKGKDTYW
jgi:hypothetical protein